MHKYSILTFLHALLDLPVETQFGLFLLAFLLLVGVVLGPGGVAAVLDVEVVHLVLLSEALSDAHHELVLPPLDADGVQRILQQSNFLPLSFKAVLFTRIPPPLQALLLHSEGLYQHHQPILEFFDVSLESLGFFLCLVEHDLVFEVVVGLVFALDLALLARGFEAAGVVLEGELLVAGCFLLREEGTAYFCFQYSIYWSLAMRSSLAASSSRLRLLNCSCTSSLDSLGWLQSRLFQTSTPSRCSMALSSRLRRRFYYAQGGTSCLRTFLSWMSSMLLSMAWLLTVVRRVMIWRRRWCQGSLRVLQEDRILRMSRLRSKAFLRSVISFFSWQFSYRSIYSI